MENFFKNACTAIGFLSVGLALVSLVDSIVYSFDLASIISIAGFGILGVLFLSLARVLKIL